MVKKPRVLIFDIETAPMEVYVWGLGEQRVGYEQIKKDWHLMSYSAKWLDEKPIMYRDQRHEKDVSDDRKILKDIHRLLDECDIVVTQNGKRFDVKKVNARFIQLGMKPPSPYKHIDALTIKSGVFGFTSNKLAYTTSILNEKHKKLTHKKFPGLELWKECLNGNKDAWNEMEKYNKADVLSLEEEYLKLRAWDTSVNFAGIEAGCRSCGSMSLQKRGTTITAAGTYQRFQCQDCGSWSRGSANLLNAETRKNIKRKI